MDAIQSCIEVKTFDAVNAGLMEVCSQGRHGLRDMQRHATDAILSPEFQEAIRGNLATLAENLAIEEGLRDRVMSEIPMIQELAKECPVLGDVCCTRTNTHHRAPSKHLSTWKDALQWAQVLLHWHSRCPGSDEQLRRLQPLGLHHIPSWKRDASLAFAVAARERVIAIGLGSSKLRKKHIQKVTATAENCDELGEACYSVLASHTRYLSSPVVDPGEKGDMMEGVELMNRDAVEQDRRETCERGEPLEIPDPEAGLIREAGFDDADLETVISGVSGQRRKSSFPVFAMESDGSGDWHRHLDDWHWDCIAPADALGRRWTRGSVRIPEPVHSPPMGLTVEFPMDGALRELTQGGDTHGDTHGDTQGETCTLALDERLPGGQAVGPAVVGGCSDRVVLWLLYSVIATRCDPRTGSPAEEGVGAADLLAARHSCVQLAEMLVNPAPDAAGTGVRVRVFEDIADRCTRQGAIPPALEWMRHACALFLSWTVPIWRSCDRLFRLNPVLSRCSVRALKPTGLLAELRNGHLDSRAFPHDTAGRLEVFRGIRSSAEAFCNWSIRKEGNRDEDAIDFAMEMMVYYNFVNPPKVAGIHRSQRMEGHYPFRCGFNASDLVDHPDVRTEVNSIAPTVQRIFDGSPNVLQAIVGVPLDDFHRMCARCCPVYPASGEVLLLRLVQMVARCVATLQGNMLHSEFMGRSTLVLLRGLCVPGKGNPPGGDRVVALAQSLIGSLAAKGHEFEILEATEDLFMKHLLYGEGALSRRVSRSVYALIVELVHVGVIADLTTLMGSKCAEMIAMEKNPSVTPEDKERAMMALVQIQLTGVRLEFMWDSIERNGGEFIDCRGGETLKRKMSRLMRSFRNESRKYEGDLPGIPSPPDFPPGGYAQVC